MPSTPNRDSAACLDSLVQIFGATVSAQEGRPVRRQHPAHKAGIASLRRGEPFAVSTPLTSRAGSLGERLTASGADRLRKAELAGMRQKEPSNACAPPRASSSGLGTLSDKPDDPACARCAQGKAGARCMTVGGCEHGLAPVAGSAAALGDRIAWHTMRAATSYNKTLQT